MIVINITLLISASIILIIKTKTLSTPNMKNIFWALTSTVIMKTCSVITGYNELTTRLPLYELAIINNLSDLSAVVSNIFLFHFGISLLTHNIKTLIDYKIFPVLLFAGYMMLYFSGIIETSELNVTSKFSFGYNGAILGCVGCFNLFYYYKKKELKDRISRYGFLLLGLTMFIYAITEGVLTTKIFSAMVIEGLKIIFSILLVISSLTVTDVIKKEERLKKIGFI